MPGRQTIRAEKRALVRLRRRWAAWVPVGAVLLGLSGLILAGAFGQAWLRWAFPSLLGLAAVLGFIYLRLPLNRISDEGPLLETLGSGNQLTIVRGLLIAQLPGYLFLPEPRGAAAWLPALTFMAALILDYLDGFFARRAGLETRLGQALDIEFDGLATLTGAALAVHYGRLPWLYLATIGAARYLFLLAGWIAARLGRSLNPIPPSDVRRGMAGVSMEIGAAALWPIAPAPMMYAAGAILGVPFLAGFARDGLIHVGWMSPGSPLYLRLRRIGVDFATRLLPLGLRLALPILLGSTLVSEPFSYGVSVPDPVNRLGWALSLAGLGMMLLGFAGRTGAVLVLIAFGIAAALAGPSARDVAAWACTFAIYLFGTGPVSLWSPESDFYRRRAGERS